MHNSYSLNICTYFTLENFISDIRIFRKCKSIHVLWRFYILNILKSALSSYFATQSTLAEQVVLVGQIGCILHMPRPLLAQTHCVPLGRHYYQTKQDIKQWSRDKRSVFLCWHSTSNCYLKLIWTEMKRELMTQKTCEIKGSVNYTEGENEMIPPPPPPSFSSAPHTFLQSSHHQKIYIWKTLAVPCGIPNSLYQSAASKIIMNSDLSLSSWKITYRLRAVSPWLPVTVCKLANISKHKRITKTRANRRRMFAYVVSAQHVILRPVRSLTVAKTLLFNCKPDDV